MSFRDKVLKCLGEFPEKCKIYPEIIWSSDRGTHILELVSYNVEKEERINAYLLLPKKFDGRKPAVIACHQHADEYYIGKSEPAGLNKNKMYHYGLDLCLRGYVVLCPDHLGFEDRRPQEFIRMENGYMEGKNYERFLFTKYILEGKTLQAKYISDLCRGIDFLESLDFVDKDRIGVIGHSLGGQEALWLTWYDSRIKVGVSSCGFSQIHAILRDNINHNFAMYTFGFLNIGDIGDLVCDIAPRPFMMTNGTEDKIFPIDGAREIADAAYKKYMELGKTDLFKSVFFTGGHSFPDETKEEAYNWLDEFLK